MTMQQSDEQTQLICPECGFPIEKLNTVDPDGHAIQHGQSVGRMLFLSCTTAMLMHVVYVAGFITPLVFRDPSLAIYGEVVLWIVIFEAILMAVHGTYMYISFFRQHHALSNARKALCASFIFMTLSILGVCTIYMLW